MNKKYTTIIFDADDTLLDFKKAENKSLRMILENYKIKYTDKDLDQYSDINLSLWKSYEKGEIEKCEIGTKRYELFFSYLGLGENYDFQKINTQYTNNLSLCGDTIKGAEELCRILKEKEYKLYIGTNGIWKTQKERLKRSGLTKYIDDVFVSEKIGFQKPKKEFFEAIMGRIEEQDKKKILMIGDSLTSDIKGARDFGLSYLWFNTRNEAVPEGITEVIYDLKEVLDYIS